jgi:hypothetical protein
MGCRVGLLTVQAILKQKGLPVGNPSFSEGSNDVDSASLDLQSLQLNLPIPVIATSADPMIARSSRLNWGSAYRKASLRPSIQRSRHPISLRSGQHRHLYDRGGERVGYHWLQDHAWYQASHS